ncbi:unnamed protein product [Adineta steineri]|uniref:Gag-like protein n=1 Tax=Adineta steineri TaxID=433720 RepID=A0A819ND10_9BILA|nr:unnamed protein product [Adineta steineri]CAF3994737.1 unnamed protein product [Adineta steineri]
MTHHNEGYESPGTSDLSHQLSPLVLRKQNNEWTTFKRPGSNLSPQSQQHTETHRQVNATQIRMTHSYFNSKISFPPIIVKFKSEQKASIKEITDDLTSKWKTQHGIDLAITARFGHMHSLLIFADESSTFESFLDPNRWPELLKDIEIEVKVPRQFPPEYSLIIQQFHRNWNEDEWINELQLRYVSVLKLTRMRVKDGSTLNAVRADFKSIEEVKAIIKLGKIYVGSMTHPVKPYHLPIRINKCLKCLRHDHLTKSCTLARLCPRCAEEHSLENGCNNPVKCINCDGDHTSGHSACPIVQQKRHALMEQAKKQRAELLVRADQQQHTYKVQEDDYPAIRNDDTRLLHSQVTHQSAEGHRRTYAQTTTKQHDLSSQKSIEYTLSSFLDKMERRLEGFSTRLTSQLCEIEKKINVQSDRHYKLENAINEIILPAIQELSNIFSQSIKIKATQDALKNLNEKIGGIISNQRPQSCFEANQSTANQSSLLAANVSHH